MLILAMTITACTSENDDIYNESNNKKLSLNTYEKFKGQLLDVNLNKLKTNSRLEQNNYILSQVNNFYDTDIDFDNKLKGLDSSEGI